MGHHISNYLLCNSLEIVHETLGGDIAPDAVQNISILENPQQFVVRGDLVKVGSFLIGEEQVWLPDGVQHRWV